MIDHLDRELRQRLQRAALPAAPITLRIEIDHLRSTSPPIHARRTSTRHLVLLAAGLTTIAVAAGVLGLAGSSPLRLLLSSAPPSERSYGFTRPGFAFDPPSGWTDQSAAISYPTLPEVRLVGYLVHGMTSCPGGYGSPRPKPSGCEEMATRPGTATLSILELNHQYPWLDASSGQRTTIAGYPAVSYPGETEPSWLIQSPDGGIYRLALIAPKDEIVDNMNVVARALESLRLTSWEKPPTVVNGLIHEDAGRGFTFDYPADWALYYPTDISMMDSAVVTVASAPLLPPCSGANCQRFTTPPGTVAVEFRIGGGPSAPDWSKAPTTIGGQPAFGPQDWGPHNATGGDEGHSWDVRLTDRESLGIEASLRKPGLPALRAAMDDVLASIQITPQ